MSSKPKPSLTSLNDVAEANKRFYDQIADIYDQVDSRRGQKNNHLWVNSIIDQIIELLHKNNLKTSAFLDAGSGTGLLAHRALNRFDRLTLVDISKKMLDRISIPETNKICSDVSFVPVKAASFDAVGGFATLHHLRSTQDFFDEVYRILRPGGVLYTDHDIESQFVCNFRPLLIAYRKCFDHGKDFLRCCPEASEQDYILSEFHGDRGLSGQELEKQLVDSGFKIIRLDYHWEGMGGISSMIQGIGVSKWFKRRGLAPLIRILATKL